MRQDTIMSNSKPALLRAILIDPIAQHIDEIHIEPGLASIRSALRCDMIDIVQLGRDADLFVDDEGRLVEDQRCFSLPGAEIIAGRALILASDEEGETIGTRIPLAPIQAMVRWLPVGFDYTPPEPVVIGFDRLETLKFLLPR
jgi:hypothetical protein